MKKFILLLAFILTVFSLSSAYADDTPITTSLTEGGITEDVFFLNQTPWLNIIFPEVTGTLDYTKLKITSPLNVTYAYSNFTDLQNTWLNLDAVVFSGGKTWDEIKSPGIWNIKTDYGYEEAVYDAGTLRGAFTIVPEPISSALFLLGGAALFARRRKTQPKTPSSSH
jgi:hypothetical protein